jgi:lysophospholipase L1-like esterase
MEPPVARILAIPSLTGQGSPKRMLALQDRPPTAVSCAVADVVLRYARAVAATDAPTLRYVALGDSYTIGTAVEPALSWPSQLVRALAVPAGSGGRLELVANLGVDGCSSGGLISGQLPELERLRPDFVSLLVGVNDVVRGIPLSVYAGNLQLIFGALLARLAFDRIVTVPIPDYTVTPRGADFGDARQQSREIATFNATMADQSAGLGIRHVDIVDLSLRVAGDRSLVAGDGLHPSGAQYRLWVERIAPAVTDLLAQEPIELNDPRDPRA